MNQFQQLFNSLPPTAQQQFPADQQQQQGECPTARFFLFASRPALSQLTPTYPALCRRAMGTL